MVPLHYVEASRTELNAIIIAKTIVPQRQQRQREQFLLACAKVIRTRDDVKVVGAADSEDFLNYKTQSERRASSDYARLSGSRFARPVNVG